MFRYPCAALLIGFCLFPSFAHAQVVISEIMYDLEGADSGREWVELHNTGTSAVDITDWRFFEQDSNHKLSLNLGDAVVPPGGYAIVADRAGTFLEEHPGFSGIVFDSSFSLNNSGEMLILRDDNFNDIDSVTYTSDWGAAGDGKSLARDGSAWRASIPSPGSVSEVGNAEEVSSSQSENSNERTVIEEDEKIVVQKPPEFVTVNIGNDRVVTVGAAEFFEAKAYKKDGTENPYVSYRWNFGNGMVREGQKVLHQYNYPGTYVVWVAGITPGKDKLASTDRMTVTAKPANLFVSGVTSDAVTLSNESSRELNVSLWSLYDGATHFMFPENTIILPHTSVTFQNGTTGLRTTNPKKVALIYPNGRVASAYTPNTYRAAAVYTAAAGDTPPPREQAAGQTETSVSAVPQKQDVQVALAAAETAVPTLSSSGTENSHTYLYLFALVVVLGVAILAVLLLQDKPDKEVEKAGEHALANSTPAVPMTLSARDFTIFEEKEESQESKRP